MTPSLSNFPAPNPLSDEARAQALLDPGFGQHYTDHMATSRWSAAAGWHAARVEPLATLALHPATSVLHYAQEIFEGLKVYRGEDGSISFFRLGDHAARFNSSARRMAMPELPAELFRSACEELIRCDSDWVARDAGSSVYLRPFMVSTTEGLGAGRPSDSFLFAVIASPSASTGGMRDPISVWVSQNFVRSVRGGTGSAKTGANYAMGMLGQSEARRHGCDQVLWLDALERTWIEELGAMNVFLVRGAGRGATIVTPPLSDTLLPGITRDSVLHLAADLGLRGQEAPISIGEWEQGSADGRFTEAFATGSAGGLTPISRVKTSTAEWCAGIDGLHPVGAALAAALNEVQIGVRDPHRWLSPLSPRDRTEPAFERTS